MKAKSDTTDSVERLCDRWQREHQQLNAFFDEYRKWAYEIAQRGFPHFGETACRLKELRERLCHHFAKEDEIAEQLTALKEGSPEVEANRRQIAADHAHLLTRLDSLIKELEELDPPFDSWQEAVAEVERFCDALEQHEEQESDCINWLTPKKG